MVKRIITSVVALAVFVGILFLPPICFTVALAAVILFMSVTVRQKPMSE